MRQLIFAAALVTGSAIAGVAPANAGTYTLNCTDSTSGQAVTVTVTASSRSAAIEKVRNDPSYSDYDKCS